VNSLPKRSLWAGRTLALLGIVLLALNLRTAVAAISPIVDLVSGDIALDPVGLGVLGMLPPLAFATSGLLAPTVAKRIGLETTIVLACLAMIVGSLVRAIAPNYLVLIVGSILALAGMGFGNIVLPPAVKKYFPDRIGQVTAAYATILALSASIPAILAAPVAGMSGWRVSVGLWAVLALLALLPWLAVWRAHRADVRAAASAGEVPEAPGEMVGRMWRSRTAWTIGLTFAVSALNAYALFAWLPEILADIAGVDTVQAGALLSLYALIGLPFSLLVPILAVRLRSVSPIIFAGVACFLLGYTGLLLAPTTLTWLWVLLAGSGPLIFPLCLVLINLRTRSPQASVALSGVVQSIGYGVGSLGPLVVAVIHTSTGGWTAPLMFLLVTALGGIVTGIILRKPRYVEDEI